MPMTPKGRSPLALRAGLLLATLAIVVLSLVLSSCGTDGDATPPPPTIIRADETPAVEGPTATPTVTATPGSSGYPGPEPTSPAADSAYPAQVPAPGPTPESAYPGR